MALIWFAMLMESMVAYLIRMVFQLDGQLAPILIAVNVAVVEVILISQKRIIARPMLAGYVLRMALLLYDCLTNYSLSYRHYDNWAYYENAILKMKGLPHSHGGMFSEILGYVFRLTGASHPMAQYLNVLLSLTTVWVAYKAMTLLSVKKKTCIRLMWLLNLFPYSIYIAHLCTREPIIAWLATTSIYFAIKWYLQRDWKCLVLCVAALFFASTFHAGIIMLGVGYIILFATYSHRTHKLTFKWSTLPIIVLLIGLTVYIAVFYGDIFFAKFYGMTETSALAKFNRETGGSAYLSWLKAASWGQMILFSPLRLIYFMFSPLPPYLRGITDIGSFLVDALAYALMCLYCFRHRKKTRYPELMLCLAISLALGMFAYGLGTWTAGTAIRHRQKMFAGMVMLTAIASTGTEQIKTKICGSQTMSNLLLGSNNTILPYK